MSLKWANLKYLTVMNVFSFKMYVITSLYSIKIAKTVSVVELKEVISIILLLKCDIFKMGNVFKKKPKTDIELEDKKSVLFKGTSIYSAGTSIIPLSVSSLDEYLREETGSVVSTSSCTRPSVYNSQESANKSSDQKIEEVETVILTAAQLDSIYEQYKAINSHIPELFMPRETLKMVRHLFDLWQTDMIYKFDNYITYMTSDKNVVKMYADHLNDSECNPEQMFLRHSIIMIITYKMILDQAENKAEELIQQIAISHGLLGFTGSDFKVMDLHLTRYLLQRNLINDESIIGLVAFLSIISDDIAKVLSERRNQARASFVSQMATVGRPNITRDNYRCMKKWALVVPLLNSRVDMIQKQIKLHQPPKNLEDTITIDTETLKGRDFIMKNLQKKKTLKNK